VECERCDVGLVAFEFEFGRRHWHIAVLSGWICRPLLD
jgi:hypothetical protein